MTTTFRYTEHFKRMSILLYVFLGLWTVFNFLILFLADKPDYVNGVFSWLLWSAYTFFMIYRQANGKIIIDDEQRVIIMNMPKKAINIDNIIAIEAVYGKKGKIKTILIRFSETHFLPIQIARGKEFIDLVKKIKPEINIK